MAKKEYSYLEYRCDLLKFGRVMTDELRADITESKLELFHKTPFGSLFKAYYDGTLLEAACKKSDLEIVTLLKSFDKESKTFKFGDFNGALRSEDISEIFGLTMHGEEINLNQKKRKDDSGFMARQMGGVKRMNKAILEQKIKDSAKLRGIEDEKDFVRLVCLYFCVTLFLCNSGNELGWNVLPYIDDIDKMSNYAWAPLVNNHLQDSIMKMNGRPESACGCVIALLFWFCERTHFIDPIRGREQAEPKFLRWNLPELYARMKVMPIQEIKVFEEEDCQLPSSIPHNEKAESVEEIRVSNRSEALSPVTAPRDDNSLDITGRDRNLVYDFNPEKMFQLMPTQFHSGSQVGPSERGMDKSDMETKLLECMALLEFERAKNKTLSLENTNLMSEIGLLRQSVSEDAGAPENSRNLRTKDERKKPVTLNGYILSNSFFKRGKESTTSDESLVQEPPTKREKNQSADDNCMSRLRVVKCMTKKDAEKLKDYVSNTRRDMLWIGVHSKVSYKDAMDVLHEEHISRQVVDAYLEILSRDQHAVAKGRATSFFMPTFSWSMIKANEETAQIGAYLEHALKNVRDKDFIFIPIHHEKVNHFTFLVLNKSVGFWEHYNTLLPRRTTLDQCFADAANLHVSITKHFTFLKLHAQSIMDNGQIWKHVMRRGEVKLFQYKLSKEDRNLLSWLGGNIVEHFPVRSIKECPQHVNGSMDGGIGVMYIIKQLSEGATVESAFIKGAMTSMRARILERFITMPNLA